MMMVEDKPPVVPTGLLWTMDVHKDGEFLGTVYGPGPWIALERADRLAGSRVDQINSFDERWRPFLKWDNRL